MKKSKIPTSPVARIAKLVKTTGMIVGAEFGNRILESFQRIPAPERFKQHAAYAFEIAQTLGQLKGAALKAGQMLTLELSDFLPKEIVQILSSMNDSTSFMEIDEVKRILKKELGPTKLKLLEKLTDAPIASASIGQVHKAEYQGVDVAIKIQYPAVAATIDSDLSSLKRLFDFSLKMTNKKISLKGFFAEVRANLKREVDYSYELSSLIDYKILLADYPQFVVPATFPEFSSKRVLTMGFESGVRIRDYIDSKNLDPLLISHLLLTLVQLEFFEIGLVQTDPNPGNFLIRPEKSQLILLDLGSTKKFPPEFRRNVISLLRLSMEGDRAEIADYAISLSLIDPRESPQVIELFVILMKSIVSMYRPENQPFDFSGDYLNNIRHQSIDFVKLVRYTSPAKELIFLNRKLGGVFHILKDAKAKINLVPYWKQVLELEARLALRST